MALGLDILSEVEPNLIRSYNKFTTIQYNHNSCRYKWWRKYNIFEVSISKQFPNCYQSNIFDTIIGIISASRFSPRERAPSTEVEEESIIIEQLKRLISVILFTAHLQSVARFLIPYE